MRAIALSFSLVMLALCLGCSGDTERRVSGGETITIAELWGRCGYQSRRISEDFIIEGWVVATDKFNEMSGVIVIADATGGVALYVKSRDTESLAPLNSRVRLRCSGLWLGSDGRKYYLGAEPQGRGVVGMVEVGDVARHLIVCDDTHMLQPTPVSISEVDAHISLGYVVLYDVRIVEAEANALWSDDESLEDDGYDCIRHITDGCDTLRLLVDSRCDYASTPLPQGRIDCAGIVDSDSEGFALRIINYQVRPTDK